MINSSLGMCLRTRTIDSNFLKENGTYGSCSYINEPARSRQRGAEVLWLADSCLARWHLRTRHTPKSVQGIKVGDVTSQGRYTLDMTPRKEKWYKRKKSISFFHSASFDHPWPLSPHRTGNFSLCCVLPTPLQMNFYEPRGFYMKHYHCLLLPLKEFFFGPASTPQSSIRKERNVLKTRCPTQHIQLLPFSPATLPATWGLHQVWKCTTCAASRPTTSTLSAPTHLQQPVLPQGTQ